MIPLREAISSSIGRKLITAVTGIGLILFVIIHLLGNLTLLKPNGLYTNLYAATLESYGALLVVAEIGLLLFFLIHIVNGLRLYRINSNARPVKYRSLQSKGGPTKSNLSSQHMLLSGLILMVFVGVHVWQFRFGPGIAEGYVTQVKGEQVRDLYRVVAELFRNSWMVAFYVFAMGLLGLHLRHGFWSAFQSIGIVNPRTSNMIYTIGVIVAIVLAVGFLILPVWVHFQASGAIR